MEISAKMVKELRNKTGAGILDSKKALEANNGDIDASIDWLREKGIAKAAKKADRIAAEGLTKITVENNKAVIVEVNSETDFVAKNEKFINLIDEVAQALLKASPASLEDAMKVSIDNKDMETYLAEATSTIGEKISLRRFTILEKTDNDVFGAYSHMGGKIGVLLVLKNTDSEAGAKDVAMHAAAMAPQFVTREEISNEFIEKEKAIQLEMAKNDPKTADKPDNILAGIVEGKLTKQLKEIVLLDQTFVKNADQTVKEYINGLKATIGEVVRFGVGEGIEKNEVDFADEVMSQVNAK